MSDLTCSDWSFFDCLSHSYFWFFLWLIDSINNYHFITRHFPTFPFTWLMDCHVLKLPFNLKKSEKMMGISIKKILGFSGCNIKNTNFCSCNEICWQNKDWFTPEFYRTLKYSLIVLWMKKKTHISKMLYIHSQTQLFQ